MSPLPHYFGLDFTGAGPWLVAGLVVGLFLSWLWRALRGSRIDAKAQAKINEIETLLDTSRSEHQAGVARLLADARNYEQALADAEKRAAASAEKASKFTADIERLSKAELSARNELLAADDQLAKLKSNLQWAQSQALGAGQDREALEKQILRLNSERQTFTAELATAKTAAELKDAEIARLINQVRWHESRATALEQEKLGLASNLGALSSKDDEIARLAGELAAAHASISHLKGELGSTQMSLANFQSNASAGAESLTAVQTKFEQAWKDLTYMRNLAYWQASEIDRLRKAITQFEEDAAAKSAKLASLGKQYADLKVRVARFGARPGKRGHIAYFRGQGTNGTSVDSHAHAKGAGKVSFRHGRPQVSRGKAYKLGKAFAAAGPAGGAKSAGSLGTGASFNSIAARRVAFTELQTLKAKVAALSEDAAKYRRLREAVHQANRIAEEAV